MVLVGSHELFELFQWRDFDRRSDRIPLRVRAGGGRGRSSLREIAAERSTVRRVSGSSSISSANLTIVSNAIRVSASIRVSDANSCAFLFA